MRGMTRLLWETSLFDPEGGLSIPECRRILHVVKCDGEPLSEDLLWLLLT
ncbi:hypothetical protein CsatB_030089 [Cannabis sativa]